MQEIKEEFVKELLESVKRHHKKYGYRKMTIEELDKLTGI